MSRLFPLIVVAVLSITAHAQTENSQNYNLLQASLDQQAAGARLAVMMEATLALQEVSRANAGAGSGNTRVCLRIGSLINTVIGSVVRYERHAVDQAQKSRGEEAGRVAFGLAAYCGFRMDELFNPEYTKMALNVSNPSQISEIKNLRDVLTGIERIISLLGTQQ
jgi:hypothetical protein